MGALKIGDIVARKSHGYDVFFKVVDIRNDGKENIITIKGITYRIEADAPESDLVVQNEQRVREYTNKCCMLAEEKTRSFRTPIRYRGIPKKAFNRDTSNEKARKFARPGKILHIDGDSDYLETCLNEYKKLGIEAIGKHVPENEQAQVVYKLLLEHKPDILVLTGHDGLIKGGSSPTNLNNYRNSKYFIEAVKEARKYSGDLDGLVIFAGACQSMYNNIIKAGANFASSPYRVLIHALDPVRVCEKIALTNIEKVVNPREVINATITKVDGIGGVQTRGKFRDGFPMEPYSS